MPQTDRYCKRFIAILMIRAAFGGKQKKFVHNSPILQKMVGFLVAEIAAMCYTDCGMFHISEQNCRIYVCTYRQTI